MLIRRSSALWLVIWVVLGAWTLLDALLLYVDVVGAIYCGSCREF